MTLDLQQSTKTKQEKLNELLATPDLGMFMLTSPDLERFIIQQNGLVLTTPTPTSQILFPKSVTEEQEAYARGFVDALSELHKNYGPPAVSATVAPSVVPPANGKPVVATGVAADQRQSSTIIPAAVNLTTVTSLPGSVIGSMASTSSAAAAVAPAVPSTVVKMETVPSTTTFNGAAGLRLPAADLQPIDMNQQEVVKLERKRARNRLAATRCRNRKLERISRLEDRVAELKAQNTQLVQSATALRDEVCRLKREIIEHTRRGCQVMLTHNLM
jgi:transcription factor AP-1